MKVIRANKPLFVPTNPEKPDTRSMRLVQTGLVALVPAKYKLPQGAYMDVADVPLAKKASKGKGKTNSEDKEE